jgi:hypothetical protein
LKVQGVKLRVFEYQGGISKRLVVQGGLVKFPLFYKYLKRNQNYRKQTGGRGSFPLSSGINERERKEKEILPEKDMDAA